ncbi:MAG TPA: cytochrome c peroxidase [Candidatus Angelobacter sp.]|nr:cytochrome c peroxidase [Candidatus Angelobacter sp.]
MKLSSGIRTTLRVCTAVIAIVAALGYFSHVRAQSGVGAIRVPLRPLAPLSTVPVPPVFGIEGIVNDKTAAIELGKALFWDMQAGSDDIQACASCHFNAGADSRATNQVNPGQPGGDNSFQLGVPFNGAAGPNYHYNPGTADAGFGGYHDGDFPFHKVADVNNNTTEISDLNDISGSEGVFSTNNAQVIVSGGQVDSNPSTGAGTGGANAPKCQHEINNVGDIDPAIGPQGNIHGAGRIALPAGDSSGPAGGMTCIAQPETIQITARTSVETDSSVPDPVFSYPDPDDASKRINTRRTTGRNTPSAVDAVFNYRNFWDGRAQNTCNGVDPFGNRDAGAHLLVQEPDGSLGGALVNMENSALCSQSLGPILSSTEMSADGRNFHDVGRKLLARKPLARQMVDPTDSVLGALSNSPDRGLKTNYSDLVQQAFQPEWWNDSRHICAGPDGSAVAVINQGQSCPASTQEYSLMEFNFSLFWGVAIQMYESTLIADQTPLDQYLEQQQSYTLVGDNIKNTYTIQLQPGITPNTISIIGLNPTLDASDQDFYSFDDGFGNVRGLGVDAGTVNYATGTLNLTFSDPPVSQVPIRINYSVGAVPMTPGQLRGLNLFQTKAGCVVCHGGPELSNAAVGTVGPVPVERMIMEDDSARVYDTGFYHIGVRPAAEDPGLAGTDPIVGLPLSQAEYLREKVCQGGFETVIVPGRRGDGLSPAPMNCADDIARTGFFKTPQLRNVALTAPYFHNGSELTLEQVVEFYNRGGDFNTVPEVQYMDPDIEVLGLTLQDKQDLVDFLRNALTDQRTVNQAAPFDHPELFTPNGHPQSSNGYPVDKDPDHPGQAKNNFVEVPATGAKGGKPLPTFLDNLLHPPAPSSPPPPAVQSGGASGGSR